MRSAGPSTREAYASSQPPASSSHWPETAPATSATAASSRNACGFGRGPAGAFPAASSAAFASAFASALARRRSFRNRRRVGGPAGASGPPGPSCWSASASASPAGSFVAGRLNSSGISIPPANPSTEDSGATRHQSGSITSPLPSSSSPARCGGAAPRCTGTAGGACPGSGGPAADIVPTTSSGVPIRSRMRRTAAGVSGSYRARRRSISSRNPDTSRIRSPDDSWRRCAKSPTRLRYS
ncbi:hypothetical protein DRB96_38900 [Streptomyces sp. ICC1]|nr:hypothetical protein DRB96_38900 [Streptomyces sp. ICC1]